MKYDEFLLDVRHDGEIAAQLTTYEGEIQPVLGEVSLDPTLHEYMQDDIEQLYAIGLDEQRLKRLGTTLYRALFPGEIGALFERAEKETRERYNQGVRDRRLRVMIKVDPRNREVLTWPLEFLYCPPERGYLATKKMITLSRQIGFSKLDIPARQEEPPLKVLIVASTPQGLGGVMVNKVVEEIARWAEQGPAPGSGPTGSERRAAARSGVRQQPRIEVKLLGQLQAYERPAGGVDYLDQPATINQILSVADRWSPHVLHFIGHGKLENNTGYLGLIQDEYSQEAYWCSASDFAEMFSDWRPRLVVLQACQMAQPSTGSGFMSLATYLVQRSITAVVAMQFEIQNEYATSFAAGFYQSLAEGLEVDAAVQDGRWALPAKNNILWKERIFGAPVLFMLSPMGIIQPVQAYTRQIQERQPPIQRDAQITSKEEKIRLLRQQALEYMNLQEYELAMKMLSRAQELEDQLGLPDSTQSQEGMGTEKAKRQQKLTGEN